VLLISALITEARQKGSAMISTVILALCLIGDDGLRLTTSGSALGDPSS
jgi:hypothetical protein